MIWIAIAGDKERARCSCGWNGPWRTYVKQGKSGRWDFVEVRADADAHTKTHERESLEEAAE